VDFMEHGDPIVKPGITGPFTALFYFVLQDVLEKFVHFSVWKQQTMVFEIYY